MHLVIISSLLLTAIMLSLVLVVLLVRHLLGASGTVAIRVGSERMLDIAAGRRLLWALADAGIQLPAACGGKGACGQCRVRIDEGRPELSQMGAEHISPEDAQAGYRLACMVRAWTDMVIDIGEDAVAGDLAFEVVSNHNISVYLKELILRLPDNERIEFEAGDYILTNVPPYQLAFADIDVDPPFDDEWRRLGLFDLYSAVDDTTIRAYSMANPPAQGGEIRLVIRIATPPASAPANTPPGRSSSYLFGLRPGDRLDISGPFGTFHATNNDCDMVFIAGGAGIAPIRSIILDQLARNSQRRMSLWFGARDLYDLCYYEEFQAITRAHANFSIQAVLSEPRADDQWSGATGFVHTVVYEQYLRNHPAPGAVEYYLCGPPLMAVAVVQLLDELGVARDRIFVDDFGS